MRCSLAWVVVSLCGRVLAPIDVISGRRAVSDRSSGSVLGFISYLILDKILSQAFVVCRVVLRWCSFNVFLVLFFSHGSEMHTLQV